MKRTGLVATAGLLILMTVGCSTSPKVVFDPNQDYYKELDKDAVYTLAVWCLRDKSGSCKGKSAELYESNNSGADFYPGQRLTLLDWRLERVSKSKATLQFKIKDKGTFYDTTINVDSLLSFGPRGVSQMEVKDIYNGGWGFNQTFVEAAVVVGGAAVVAGSALKSQSAESSSSSEGNHGTLELKAETGTVISTTVKKFTVKLQGDASTSYEKREDSGSSDFFRSSWASFSYLPTGNYEIKIYGYDSRGERVFSVNVEHYFPGGFQACRANISTGRMSCDSH